MFVPSIVLGELYYGARKSGQAEKNLARLEEFAASSAVTACDVDTAREYGKSKTSYERGGDPSPKMISGLRPSLSNTISFWLRGTIIFFEIEDLKMEKW
ncbi:MAG: VapC toxin family PIN domain ribonuclease [Desulfotomaculales bacterium]